MSQSAQVLARFERSFPHGYERATVIVGDGQVEFEVMNHDGSSVVVIEEQEVKDIIRLLSSARYAAVQQMVDTHSMLTDHKHNWMRVTDHAFVDDGLANPIYCVYPDCMRPSEAHA